MTLLSKLVLRRLSCSCTVCIGRIILIVSLFLLQYSKAAPVVSTNQLTKPRGNTSTKKQVPPATSIKHATSLAVNSSVLNPPLVGVSLPVSEKDAGGFSKPINNSERDQNAWREYAAQPANLTQLYLKLSKIRLTCK